MSISGAERNLATECGAKSEAREGLVRPGERRESVGTISGAGGESRGEVTSSGTARERRGSFSGAGEESGEAATRSGKARESREGLSGPGEETGEGPVSPGKARESRRGLSGLELESGGVAASCIWVERSPSCIEAGSGIEAALGVAFQQSFRRCENNVFRDTKVHWQRLHS